MIGERTAESIARCWHYYYHFHKIKEKTDPQWILRYAAENDIVLHKWFVKVFEEATFSATNQTFIQDICRSKPKRVAKLLAKTREIFSTYVEKGRTPQWAPRSTETATQVKQTKGPFSASTVAPSAASSVASSAASSDGRKTAATKSVGGVAPRHQLQMLQKAQQSRRKTAATKSVGGVAPRRQLQMLQEAQQSRRKTVATKSVGGVAPRRQLQMLQEANRPQPGRTLLNNISKPRSHNSNRHQRYGHGGANGALCDVCFQTELDEFGGSSFIKCRECELVVHSNCYDAREIPVDANGMFHCDICKDLTKRKGRPRQRQEALCKTKHSHIVFPVESPGPLGSDIEAWGDGRVYPGPDEVSVDIFCQFCARRDVIGGMKPAENNTYLHLSCAMSTTNAVLNSNGVFGGIRNPLLVTQEEQKDFEQEKGFKATCEACLRPGSGAMLLRCEHGKGVDQCTSFLHPLCAEIVDRKRVIKKRPNGDVIGFKCALHSYCGKLDVCIKCRSGIKQDKMVECDGCRRGCHLFCMEPPMDTVPEGDWFCQSCVEKGRRGNTPAGKKRKL